MIGQPAPGAPPIAAPHRAGYEPLGRIEALDGLRTIAVVAVIVFHADLGMAKGGFLGVSMFFTLSGFLITSLLIRQWGEHGRIDLRRFWSRRFRRLLPASWFTVALVVAMGAVGVWDTEQLRALRGDVGWSLAELVNWHFISSGTTYGDTFSPPSPLEHFWSLAIEQQFYLVMPVLLMVGLGIGPRRGAGNPIRVLSIVLLVLIGASLVANAVLSQGSVNRAYFGTDTRAAELLIGALLATLTLRQLRFDHRGFRGVLNAAGFVALGVLLWLFAVTGLSAAWLHPWGLFATSLCTLAMILATLQRGWFARLLALPPFPHIGRISYGIYLLHFPIFLWLTPARVGLTVGPTFVLRCAVTLGTATVMYHLLEVPIRERKRPWQSARLWPVLPVMAAAVLLLNALSTAELPAAPDFLEPRAPGEVAVREVPTTRVPPSSAASPSSTEPTQAPSSTVAPAVVPPQRVLLVGDSIAASLEDELGDALIERGVAFGSAASPGCGVITGTPADANGNALEVTAACEATIPQLQTSSVAEVQPDLVVVLSSWEAAHRVVDGVTYWMGTDEADEVISGLFDEAIERLSAGGAVVALATVPNEVDGEIRAASDDNNRRIDILNALLFEVAQRHRGVTTLRVAQMVCPEDPCPIEVEGVTLRPRDGTHFDDSVAARVVADQIATAIAEIDLRSM